MDSTSNRSGANLYRTRWLMAHNCVHDMVVHGANLEQRREEYLQELQRAEEIANKPT